MTRTTQGRRIVLRGGTLDGRPYTVAVDVAAITAPHPITRFERYEPTQPRELDEHGREVWTTVEMPTMTPEQRERFEAQR